MLGRWSVEGGKRRTVVGEYIDLETLALGSFTLGE